IRVGKFGRGADRICALRLGGKAAAAKKTAMAGRRYMKHLCQSFGARPLVRAAHQGRYRLFYCGMSRKCKTFLRGERREKRGCSKAAELVRPNDRQGATGKQLQNRPNQAHLSYGD